MNDDSTAKPPSIDPVDRVFGTIRLIMTGFSVLFVFVVGALAFVGWKTVSDVGRITKQTVEIEVSKLVTDSETNPVKEGLLTFVDELKELREEIETLKGGVAEAKSDLGIIQEGETDPVGDFLRLRSSMEKAKDLQSPEIRKQAEAVFVRLIDAHKRETEDWNSDDRYERHFVTADVLFDAAGTASEFDMNRLASALATGAFSLHDTQEHKARMIRGKVRSGEMSHDDGMAEVMELLASTEELHYVHLLLSEAFNVAFIGGRLKDFVNSLEKLSKRFGERTPSYVWMVKAKATLVIGLDVMEPFGALETGLEKLSRESPRALWFADAVNTATETIDDLLLHPTSRREARALNTTYSDLLRFDVRSLGSIDSPDESVLSSIEIFVPPPPTEDPNSIDLGTEVTVVSSGWRWFILTETEGGKRVITATSHDSGLDPMIAVRDDQGDLVDFDDDGGLGFNARLEIVTEAGSRYFIGVGPARGVSVEGTVVLVEGISPG